MIRFPDGKRYRTVASHYRELYGSRLQKLVVDGEEKTLTLGTPVQGIRMVLEQHPQR